MLHIKAAFTQIQLKQTQEVDTTEKCLLMYNQYFTESAAKRKVALRKQMNATLSLSPRDGSEPSLANTKQ